MKDQKMIALLVVAIIIYLIINTALTIALITYTQHLHHHTVVATTRILYNPENPGTGVSTGHWTAIQ